MTNEISTGVDSADKAGGAKAVAYHPIRGAMYGLVLGIGLVLLLITFAVITIQFVMPVIVIILATVLGGVWGRFGPPRAAS